MCVHWEIDLTAGLDFLFVLYMHSKTMNYNCDILLNLKMVVEKFHEDEVDADMQLWYEMINPKIKHEVYTYLLVFIGFNVFRWVSNFYFINSFMK